MSSEIAGLLLALHLLAAMLWVGGMGFAILVLRPSLGLLPPSQRMTLHAAVFKRFFKIIWHAMPILLLSGYGMLFGLYGGFADASPLIHVMHLFGLVMAAFFLVIWFVPWKAMKAAQAAGDTVAAAAAAERIRKLVLANLILGAITLVVGAFLNY